MGLKKVKGKQIDTITRLKLSHTVNQNKDLRDSSVNFVSYFKKGVYYENMKIYDKAIENFNEALKLNSIYADAYFFKGLVYTKIEDYDKAIENFNEVIRLKPAYALSDGFFGRGIVYEKIKDYDNAINDFTKIIELNFTYADAYFGRGNVYYKKDNYGKTIEDYNEAIKNDPAFTDAFINRGLVYEKIEEYDKALKDFNKTIELIPTYADAYFNRGNVNYEIEKYEKAVEDYTVAININPAYTEAFINRGLVYEKIEEFGKSIEDFNKIIELNPNDIDALNRIKKIKSKINSRVIKKETILSIPKSDKELEQNNCEKKVLEEKREYEYSKMKIFATSLFILMAIVFIISHIFENQLPLLSYTKAFSEAAMIGALADWFAVVALFRKPLGFPYHTAIIPNNKNRMGESLGQLVQENFLTPDSIMEQFKTINIVDKGISLLKKKEERLLEYVYKIIPELLNHIDKEEVKNAIVKKIQAMKFTKVISDIFELLTNENRHQDLLDLTLDELRNLIIKNKNGIIKEIREHEIDLGEWVPNFKLPKFVAEYIAKSLITWFESEFNDIKEDPFHKIRKKLNKIILNVGSEIKENKNLQNLIDEKIKSVILNKVVIKYFDSIWLELKENIKDDLESQDSKIKSWVNSTYHNLVEYIEENQELSKEIDEDIKLIIREFLVEEKDNISKMISKKVRDTPEQEISDLIESYVGKDLQYIRINGTLVGGFVGLIIFLFTKII